MCSLEVPDIQNTIADTYANNSNVQILLANAGDSPETAEAFLRDNNISIPTILDEENSVYSVYPRNDSVYAPFPVNLVIDQEGTIQYLAFQHDLAEVSAVIDRLLEDNN